MLEQYSSSFNRFAFRIQKRPLRSEAEWSTGMVHIYSGHAVTRVLCRSHAGRWSFEKVFVSFHFCQLYDLRLRSDFTPKIFSTTVVLSVTDYRLSSRSVDFLRNGFLATRLILLHILSKRLRCLTVTWICRVQAQAQACPMARA